tara:strand:- start:1811 stop:2032 length:222 start_codon:yes stop_codon:yes gene_type:complete
MDDVCFATVKVVVDLLAPVESEESLLQVGSRLKNLETTESTLEILRALYKARLRALKERTQEEIKHAANNASD